MSTSRLSLWILASLVIGWSLAAQGEQDPSNTTGPTVGGDGPYAVAVDSGRAVLVEGASGRTWLLTDSPLSNEPPAWLPLERVDDPQEAIQWRRAERPRSANQELDDLRTQLQVMQKRYGPAHSNIVELQQQIEQLEQNIDQPESNVTPQQKNAIATYLLPLLLEESELLQKHGEDHPDVVSLRKKIQMTRELLQEELSQEPLPENQNP